MLGRSQEIYSMVFKLDGCSFNNAHQREVRMKIPMKRSKGDLSIEITNHSKRIFTLIQCNNFRFFSVLRHTHKCKKTKNDITINKSKALLRVTFSQTGNVAAFLIE